MTAEKIPAEMAALFEGKAVAHFATLMPDGTPQVTPVWIDREGDMLLVNSAKGRVKDRNVRANPKVGLSITDPGNPYRHLSVQGEVVEIREKGAEEHIDRLAKRYMGVETYPYRQPGQERVIYVIRPTRIHTMG
jgi:PPOX class probable F420-dependent enzyme